MLQSKEHRNNVQEKKNVKKKKIFNLWEGKFKAMA